MSSNKPFPSSDLDVFKENSLILDNFVNSQENEYPDRFARKRPTITGIIKEAFNVRTDISNMNETLIGQSRWDVVPKNTSLSLGGDNGALNKQAQALFNRTEMLKVHARETLRRTYQEAGYNLVEGSFEQGGVLNNQNDVLLQERTGKVFSGPAGTVPAGTSTAGFIDISHASTRASSVVNNRTVPNGDVGTVQAFINSTVGVSIWDYADAVVNRPTSDPATWDWTPAFNQAILSGRKINIPSGVYRGNNVQPAAGMIIAGEGGESGKTILEASVSDGAFFAPDTSTKDLLNIIISGVRVRAGAGVSGADFWRQNFKGYYTGYAYFDDIEIERSIQCGFNGFFIFTDWVKCRSGYRGIAGAIHHFIKSTPHVAGQDRQTNLNSLSKCRLFGSVGAPAVDIEYGVRWNFDRVDFEKLSSPAIRALGIYGGHINGSWFEAVSSQYMLELNNSPNPNSQGSRPWDINNCQAEMSSTTKAFILCQNASTASLNNIIFSRVPVGTVCREGVGTVTTTVGLMVVSGAGASEFNNITNKAPLFPNGNALPFGLSGVPATRLTNAGFTSIADDVSLVGWAANTARLRLAGTNNAAYYNLPTKTVEFLRGKRIKIAASGSFIAATPGESITVALWEDNPSPTNANKTVGARIGLSTSTMLSSGDIDYEVGSSATSISVGVAAGGSAPGAVWVLETMQVIVL